MGIADPYERATLLLVQAAVILAGFDFARPGNISATLIVALALLPVVPSPEPMRPDPHDVRPRGIGRPAEDSQALGRCRNSRGVVPVALRQALLNVDFDWKPASHARSRTGRSDCESARLTCSIRCSFTNV